MLWADKLFVAMLIAFDAVFAVGIGWALWAILVHNPTKVDSGILDVLAMMVLLCAAGGFSAVSIVLFFTIKDGRQ